MTLRPRLRSGSTTPTSPPSEPQIRMAGQTTVRSNHCIFDARSTGPAPIPVRSRTRGRWPASSSCGRPPRSGGPATRWPGAAGSPLRRSQATTVSRWLVIPMARATGRGRPVGRPLRPAWPAPPPRSARRRAPPSRAGVVLGDLAVATSTTLAVSSTTRARTPVVPASMAMVTGARRGTQGL